MFRGTAKVVPEKLALIYSLFRRKYADNQVDRWYGGRRSRRKPVEVELIRVLGKKPSGKSGLLEIAL